MGGPISEVSTPDLIDRITELTGHLNAATARRLVLIAEFDRLWWFHEPDGSLLINGRLPAELGALFIKALQAAEDAVPPKDVSAETFT